VTNFQWVWRYSCLNVTHKKPYNRYEEKTNYLFIAFIGYVNNLGNSTCSSFEVVLAFLLYEGSTIHNASDQFVSCVYFFFIDFAFHPSPQTKN